jgi:MIP family channel proteins
MDSSARGKCVAEFLGTFAIVFFGAGSVCVSRMNESLGLVGISLAFGMTVAVMVSSLGHVSGAHFNPAVTCMALVTRRITPMLAVSYVGVQLAGGIAAAFVLRESIDETYWSAVHLGTTTLHPSLHWLTGLGVEFLLTFFLVLVIFGTAIDARGHPLGGIAIGAVVCLDILVGGPLSGASMNPARTFGPALLSNTWTHHWIYWIGPVAGALSAAWVYERLVAPRRAPGC